MKKLFMVMLFFCLSATAHATKHIYIYGIASFYNACGEPYYTGPDEIDAGPCVRENYNGIYWATINGVYVSTYFDVEPYYTAAYVAQDLANLIQNQAGVNATVVVLDPEDNPYPQYARIDLDDSVTIGEIGEYGFNADWQNIIPWQISLTPIAGFE